MNTLLWYDAMLRDQADANLQRAEDELLNRWGPMGLGADDAETEAQGVEAQGVEGEPEAYEDGEHEGDEDGMATEDGEPEGDEDGEPEGDEDGEPEGDEDMGGDEDGQAELNAELAELEEAELSEADEAAGLATKSELKIAEKDYDKARLHIGGTQVLIHGHIQRLYSSVSTSANVQTNYTNTLYLIFITQTPNSFTIHSQNCN